MAEVFDRIALVVAFVLPLWNIPLIVNMIRRKSSRDISAWWLWGVWLCILLMAPSGFRSPDVVWRMFNMCNVVFFTAVFLVAMRYRKKPEEAVVQSTAASSKREE